MLHRGALQEDDPQISVQLSFDIGEDNPLTITRTWHFFKRGKLRDLNTDEGEEVIIYHNNKPKRYASSQEANNRIQEVLFPAHVLPCFFFNGEQAQKRVEGAGNMALRDAVQTLYGTRLLSGLSDTLRQYSMTKKSMVKRVVADVREDELAAKRTQYDVLEGSLKEVKGELARVRADLQVAEAARRDKQEELVQISGSSAADMGFVSQEKSALEQTEREQKEQLQKISLLLPCRLLSRSMRTV